MSREPCFGAHALYPMWCVETLASLVATVLTVVLKGHAFCADCLNRYAAGSRRHQACPQCRALFQRTQLHPIFLEPADSSSQQPTASSGSQPACHSEGLHCQVAKTLRKVNEVAEDQRLETVARAAKGMKDVYELMDKRDCMLVSPCLRKVSAHLAHPHCAFTSDYLF